jgi:hypothetical protein
MITLTPRSPKPHPCWSGPFAEQCKDAVAPVHQLVEVVRGEPLARNDR